MNTNLNTAPQNTISLDEVIEIGGGVPEEARLIDFDGGRFIVPRQYAQEPMKGAQKLMELFQAMEESISQTKTFEYRPNDVMVALARVLRRIGVSHSTSNSPMRKPSEVTLNTGFNSEGKMTTTVVPDDWSSVPGSKTAKVMCSITRSGNGGHVGYIQFEFQRFDQPLINGIIALVQKELDERSIYRGHVIDGALSYIDVSQVKPDRVVYTAETGGLLDTWALSTITNRKALSEARMKTKVSVMLTGTYGTGKTEFLLLISHVAWLHGWTVIFARPGIDDFGQVLETARMYMKHGEGVLVVAEDVESWGVSRERMLDMWDGFGSKQDNALFIVTSNFPDRLDPAMLRPGRLDAVIQIGQLDVPSFEKLCRNKLGDLLADDVDFAEAFAANADYTPAFMVGALESVVRATVARTGEAGKVTTADLVTAANSFRAQHELQRQAAERKDPLPTMDQVFRQSVAESVPSEIEVDVDYDVIREQVDSVIESRVHGATVTRNSDGEPWGTISTC